MKRLKGGALIVAASVAFQVFCTSLGSFIGAAIKSDEAGASPDYQQSEKTVELTRILNAKEAPARRGPFDRVAQTGPLVGYGPVPWSVGSCNFGGGNDSFTKILLHMDGTNGGTTFTDSNAGGSAHTWTASSATTNTSVFKFGTASQDSTGGGKFISTPDSTDFTAGSGDFTIDLWFNTNGAGNGTVRYMFGHEDAAGTAAQESYAGRLGTGNVLICEAAVGATINTATGTTAVTTAGWHHAACIRNGSTWKAYLDGNQEASVAISGTVNDSTQVFAVGRIGAYASQQWNGYIDEFRLSVGIARWTANFTPPTCAYTP